MNPFKVYLNNKLFDIVYASNGKSIKSIKDELVKDGLPNSIVIKKMYDTSRVKRNKTSPK